MVIKKFFRDFGRSLGGLGWRRQVKNTITFCLNGGRWKVREGKPLFQTYHKRKEFFSILYIFIIKFSFFSGYKIVKLWLFNV